MHFLDPHALYFLCLSGLPVILYLLFRRRKQEVSWGATYILRQVLASRRTRTLWQQLVVIALRTVLLALLVVAFARPFFPRSRDKLGAGFPHPPGTLHRVLLVDNSLSMNASHGTVSRMDAARQAVSAMLASMRPGDVCHVITLCPQRPGAPVAAAAVLCPLRPDAALSRAADIVTVPTPPAFLDALRAAVEAFRGSATASRQLILISDLARCDHPSISDYELFGTLLAELNVRMATLALNSRDALNLAVENVTAGTELFLTGQPTNVHVLIANYSEAGAEDSRLQFLVDGKELAAVPCILPAGARKTFVFPVTLETGPHSLEARLGDDAYLADNRVERFVRAEPALRVLAVVPDEEQSEGFAREGAFLQRAFAAAGQAAFQLKTETLKRSLLTPRAFEDRDVVVLCGISKLPGECGETLASFVRRGGGLILAAGAAVDAAAFNQSFAKLLPASLAAPYRADFSEEKYLAIQPAELAAPLLGEFAGAENGDLSLARVYNHFRVAAPVEDANAKARTQPQTLLSLSNGDPALLGGVFGKGCVLLWTSSLGAAWNSLPLHQSFLPLLYRLLNLAGGFHAPARNVKPGEPLVFDAAGQGGPLYVTTPDSRLLECPLVAVGARAFVRFEQTAAPGRYDLQDSAGHTLASFSVAMPLAESDLRSLDNDELAHFRAALKTTVSSRLDDLKAALWSEGEGDEQTGWLFLAVLALLLLDAVLTRIWFS
ncbi:MAG: BatA domain-containing protein [Planctomycetota bacterium]